MVEEVQKKIIMIKVKRLLLKNYCGFKNIELDFSKSDNLIIMFGPNGCGKSTLLNSINILSSPWAIQKRTDLYIFLKRLTFNSDYLPGYENSITYEGNMIASIIFELDGKEIVVKMENYLDEMEKEIKIIDGKQIVFQTGNRIKNGKQNGIVLNELPIDKKFYAFYIDADNPVNLNKFQISNKYKNKFLDLAEAVYGFKCELSEGDYNEVEEYDDQTKEYIIFYTDFIINKISKYGTNRTHFKAMSAGEKKIANLLSSLCNPLIYDNYDIFLIDNIELHIYFKRHMLLMEKIKEHFSNKQIIATTHSSVIVDNLEKKHLFDFEKYI